MKLMLIANDPEVAQYAVQSGVDRVFVDLERNGKVERQGHLDTVISSHSFEDAYKVKKSIADAQMLIRLNPFHDNTKDEVERALDAGADILMIPMFYGREEVEQFCAYVNGRCDVIPLVETAQAMVRLDGIAEVEGITEIYFGLNDLHLALKLDFMFEILSGGLVDYMAGIVKLRGLRFGFGGISRFGSGIVSGELVLGEHARLGSESVILSRAFHGNAKNLQELIANVDLEKEIRQLRLLRRKLIERSPEETEKGRLLFKSKVEEFVKSRRDLVRR
ncbi:aldolase/citrate lyase family protein [Cohnella phaseoli]|uniref:HpcH/HpaI aldolase/citrate lyase family protein n=1 Tax=Cohnella phaseoli TaxID=456490 RepID=A0A3D9KCA7_9BACL|nr:aldolase/citrate lyase family protein [Cohnella phaseoli]RED84028.1 HpcH/HpaI aldolase/citrate lyase family protein [Cohnella phaseoli]